MPDEPLAEGQAPEPASDPSAEAEHVSPAEAETPVDATTPSGYSYTVVHDDDATAAHDGVLSGGRRGVHPLLLVGVAIAAAVIAGVVVWFVASSGGADKDRVNADVSNVVTAFSQASGSSSKRYEGTLAPGYPDGFPAYPGAKIVSSLRQTQGEDASYLVIYDTHDSRQKVGSYFEQQLNADPWQVDAGQDGRDSTLHQFSKIDDPNIRGLVLAAESSDNKVTTIVVSLQITSGAKDLTPTPFSPGVAKTLPEGFPDGVPQYPDAVLIEAGFQKQPNAKTFAVSFVTKDNVSQVLDYYRKQLADGGLTVTDGDASQSTLQSAEAVQFTDAQQTLGGQVTAGTFADDDSYTRIDLQVSSRKTGA